MMLAGVRVESGPNPLIAFECMTCRMPSRPVPDSPPQFNPLPQVLNEIEGASLFLHIYLAFLVSPYAAPLPLSVQVMVFLVIVVPSVAFVARHVVAFVARVRPSCLRLPDACYPPHEESTAVAGIDGQGADCGVASLASVPASRPVSPCTLEVLAPEEEEDTSTVLMSAGLRVGALEVEMVDVGVPPFGGCSWTGSSYAPAGHPASLATPGSPDPGSNARPKLPPNSS
jgi:hypothetical protein